MRTLTPLILLPLVVLAPLLMAPIAYAIDVEPQPIVFVAIQSNMLVDVNNAEFGAMLAAFAIGTPLMLSGQAEIFVGDPGEHAAPGESRFGIVSGFLLNPNIAMLAGRVTRSTDSGLLGTPVALTANATDGRIVFMFGPVLSERLAGQTFTFAGTGTVIIVCLDCRSD